MAQHVKGKAGSPDTLSRVPSSLHLQAGIFKMGSKEQG